MTTAPTPDFPSLGLDDGLCGRLAKRDIVTPTPVQAAVIPLALEGGDLLAQARTGSGKTLAFLLPLAARIDAGQISRAWIVCPTRELAQQVAREAGALLGAGAAAVLVGGTPPGPQIRDLRRGVPFVVGTPGRMCDLLGQGHLQPDADILVLDEADQMLDLGFREELEHLVHDLGPEVARWCFSATFPPPVRTAINAWLEQPRRVHLDVDAGSSHVPQRYVVVDRQQAHGALARLLHLLDPARSLVFVRTREDVELAVRAIAADGIEAAGISGDLAQEARERVLARFRSGHLPVLVGTDVAARGIDVPGITHVFNLGLPMGAEAYTHRIGRTARAGAEGEAWTLISRGERTRFLRMVERARCRVDESPLPTAAALVAARRQRLGHRVVESLGEGLDLPAPFDALCDEHGAPAVLAALVHRLIPDAPPEPKAPRKSPPPPRAKGRQDRGQQWVRLRLGFGFHDGAGPGPIVALLCRCSQVSAQDIGRIRCASRHSIIEVSPPAAAIIIRARLSYRGRPLDIRSA